MLFSRFSFALFVVLALFLSGTHAAEIQSVQVGIDGYYKNGFWTPITISWSGDKAEQVNRLLLETFDSDGTPVRNQFDSGFEKIGEQFRVTVYTKLGRNTGEIVLKLCLDETVLAEKRMKPNFSASTEIRGTARKTNEPDSSGVLFPSPVPQERPIILVLAANDGGLQDAVSLLRLKDTRRPVLLLIDSLNKMPTDRLGLDAIELICLTASVPNQWDGLTADNPRIQAMLDWMQLGGHIFFSPGKASESLLSGENAPLAPFLPGRFERMTMLRQAKPLELYSESNRAIIMDGSEAAPFLEMPFLAEPQGTIVLAEADLPLIIRQSRGFGLLTYFGPDLTVAPLADWRDRGQFITKLLDWGEAKSKGTTVTHALIHPGYHDLSGQIRSALDRFDGIKVVPFSLILVLITLYSLLIGPLDWYVVHKVLKKPLLTWITFPFWIVAFCWIAAFLGTGNRVNPLTINSVDMIDLAPREQIARVSTWGDVYSPKDARYDISLKSEGGLLSTGQTDSRFDFHWLGLSGSGLGGMEPKTIALNLWDEPYKFLGDESGQLKNVPIRVRATKSFFGQWTGTLASQQTPDSSPGGLFSGTVFHQTDGIPVGNFTNELSVALDNAVLVYRTWVLKLGRLESGQTVSLGTGTTRRELRMLLNSTPAGFEDDLYAMPGHQAISYNPQSTDVWPILRTMTFFRTFGGYDSIGLHNTLHPSLDWSSVLTTNRAILVAQVDSDSLSFGDRIAIKPSGKDEMTIGTTGRHTTIVRILLPVE